jgi:hypothetical protein
LGCGTRQKLGVAHLGRTSFDIVGDLVKVLGQVSEHLLQVGLPRYLGQSPGMVGFVAVMGCAVHKLKHPGALIIPRQPDALGSRADENRAQPADDARQRGKRAPVGINCGGGVRRGTRSLNPPLSDNQRRRGLVREQCAMIGGAQDVIDKNAVIGQREKSTAIEDWHAAKCCLAFDDQTPASDRAEARLLAKAAVAGHFADRAERSGDGSVPDRLFWHVADQFDYLWTLATLRILDALTGPEPETPADHQRECERMESRR